MKKLKFSYPRGNFPRLCLMGNSNVGKSSLTRLILTHPKWYKGKVGKTAGSTVKLTIINDPKLNFHVIDLPGFGKMVRLDRKSEGFVQDQILKYVELDRENIFLMLVVVSVDRLDEELEKWYFQNPDTIPLTVEMIQFTTRLDVPTLLVLNKVDKLNTYQLKAVKEKLIQVLRDFQINLPPSYGPPIDTTHKIEEIIEVSAKKGEGIRELKQIIREYESRLDLKKFDPRNQLFQKPPIDQKKRSRE